MATWDFTKSAQEFFESGEFYDKSLGITPAINFALPTSQANSETNFTYQQSSAMPMLSANQRLRNFSPFTMRVMPPLLYLDNPDLLTGTETGDVNMGLYDSAISNNSNFANFISTVSSYNQPNGNATTFSQANNPNFASNQARSVGARPTTKLSEDKQSDQMFESAITDFQVAEEMAQQLDMILKAPPITFYINPNSFAVSYTKKHQFTERTRNGFVFQAWGEDQPKISVSGRIGSFVSGRGRSSVAVPTGHQFGSKLDSASFQQLMALLTLYKNNGYIYDLMGNSNAHHMIGCIAIEYDKFTYFGHFESFEWGYEETNQMGGLSYSFNFTVSRMYDNSQSSLLVVTPQKSPIPIPGNPTMGVNNVPNSIRSDNRFVDRGVELQSFAQQQASSASPTVLRSTQESETELESGDFQQTEETLQVPTGTTSTISYQEFVFNNTNGERG